VLASASEARGPDGSAAVWPLELPARHVRRRQPQENTVNTEKPIDIATGGPVFCANPHCRLHVRAGDPGVSGWGNWAILPGGTQIGRGRYDGRYLCDLCGRAYLATGRLPQENTRRPEAARSLG